MNRNSIRFIKMHGLGNDFMLIDAIQQKIDIPSLPIKQWSNRHTGVGFDQLLVITPSNSPKADFGYRIFNADASEAEQCGNGVRCVARYLRDAGYVTSALLRIATSNTLMRLEYLTDQNIQVNMGEPNFSPAALPFIAPAQALRYDIHAANQPLEVGAVSMGNPHLVLLTTDIKTVPVVTLGAELSQHERCPQQANIGFMQIVNRQTIKLRVYERGAAETLACGSGACAAMVIARLWNKVDATVQVQLPGGNLTITWEGTGKPVFMTGKAEYVFQGEITL